MKSGMSNLLTQTTLYIQQMCLNVQFDYDVGTT